MRSINVAKMQAVLSNRRFAITTIKGPDEQLTVGKVKVLLTFEQKCYSAYFEDTRRLV